MHQWDRLAKEFAGDAPDSNVVFVVHTDDMQILGLLSAGVCSLKRGDKITSVEKDGIPGAPTLVFNRPLYIFEVQPAGWGLGDLGYDLFLVYTTKRPPTGRGS
jgi:hypothetical protein